MQFRHARFKARPQQRRSISTGDLASKLRGEKPNAGKIDPLTGTEDDVVECARTIIQIERDAMAAAVRCYDRSPGQAFDCAEAGLKPAGRSRFQTALGEPITRP